MFFFDPTIVVLIPGLIVALWAQVLVQTAYGRYSRVRSSLGYTGYDVAKRLLENAGLYNVGIEVVSGTLTDHYDPIKKVVRISAANYRNDSIAAIGVVAHEVGHALQDAEKYPLLVLRSAIGPTVATGSNLAWIIFVMGLIFFTPFLVRLGILLFSLVVLFTLITLPVELNASSRAMKILRNHLFMPEEELRGVRKVLRAAALTYVAAALTAVLQLLRMILIVNMYSDRR